MLISLQEGNEQLAYSKMCKLGVLYLEYCSNHMQAGIHLTASTYMSINRICLTLNECMVFFYSDTLATSLCTSILIPRLLPLRRGRAWISEAMGSNSCLFLRGTQKRDIRPLPCKQKQLDCWFKCNCKILKYMHIYTNPNKNRHDHWNWLLQWEVLIDGIKKALCLVWFYLFRNRLLSLYIP